MATIHDPATWHCHITLKKFRGDWTPEKEPFAVEHYDGNMLVYGGVSLLWQFALGNGVTTAGQALTFLNNSRAAIGVGDSSTATAATQTDLQATTNKLRKAMDTGFPSHTDGTTSTNNTLRFRSTFDTTEANFAWNEAGVFNSATAATGRMLNRKVQSMGTKTSTASWQITFDVSIQSVDS